jgi:hypothetical protein
VDGERPAVRREHLTGVVRAALGDVRRIDTVTRLRGGTKKGVYRVAFEGGSTVVVYSWDAGENYWPEASLAGDASQWSDPFSDASGIGLFEAAHRRLDALGIRTPRVHLADRSRQLFPADVAVVEDVRGGTLEAMLAHDRRGAAAVLAQLGEALRTMAADRGPGFGKVALIDGGGKSRGRSCEQVVLDRALGDLAEAASRDARLAQVRDRTEEVVRTLAAAVRPRAEHSLIHGELGPDHVLVDERGRPVIIDIEGLMYFDAEWEHVFLRLRFSEHYSQLAPTGLDEERLAFYRLAMHLSLVAGPLRLLDGDFPDREFMKYIAEGNLDEVLAIVRPS